MPKSLSHLVNEVPPTLPESVPDSCGEESSDEETSPKPLSGNARVSRSYGIYSFGPESRKNGIESPPPPRSKIHPISSTSGAVPGDQSGRTAYQAVKTNQPTFFFTVQWRKPQTKKTWDGDAVIKIEGNRITMTSEDGGHMASSALLGGMPVPGLEMRIGSYEVEVDREIDATEYKQTTCILNKPQAKAVPIAYAPSTYAKPFKAPAQTHATRPSGGPIKAIPAATGEGSSLAESSRSAGAVSAIGYKPIQAESFYGSASKKVNKVIIGERIKRNRTEWGGALHDPNAEGAVVMKRPSEKEAERRGAEIVDVVLDPFLASKMREHQKEGVKFMYSCVMGMTGAEAEGCILADEMGLGKTLQTIGLIHTLLKQSPFSNQVSIIGKALVVCPVSLVENWKKEFRKWWIFKKDRMFTSRVSPMQINAVAADGADHIIKSFIHHRGQHVLIIGYERLRKVIGQLASCQPPIDLIVCDEGHRLKSKDNKTTKMFNQLRTQRRIILSGTPVQNDLSEYHAMVDFTCPGLLGTYNQFVKHYEKPIMKSRTPGCSEVALEDGRMRAEELGLLSKEFVLRRTADVLENYLPPKHEYVVFVAPTTYQLKSYGRVLSPDLRRAIIRGEADKQPLGYIDLMRKIANTPMILRLKKQDDSRTANIVQAAHSALQDIPDDMNTYDVTASGKLLALDRILHAIHGTTQEKVVIVSNFTSTLNVIQEVCKKRKYPLLRLDGSTPQKQRIDAVDSFNRSRREESFVFLLSAKAGGVGLNLIGASRLIVFDSDWNPSTDLQAMARIHRDGQKKPVYIYRFLTTNSIDEKIYQRQITKTGLANQMMDQDATQEKTRDSFTSKELKDIFSVNLRTNGCQTHDLLLCNCVKYGSIPVQAADSSTATSDEEDDPKPGFVPASQANTEPTKKMLKKAAVEQREKLAELKHWTHMDGFSKSSFSKIADTILHNMVWDHWDGDSKTATTATTTTSSTTASVVGSDDIGDGIETHGRDTNGNDNTLDLGSDGDGRPRKKRFRVEQRDDLRNFTDDEFDEVSKKGRLTVTVEGKDDYGLFSSDEDDIVAIPSKRKSLTSSNGGRSKGKRKQKAIVDGPHDEKQHDLMAIAEAGGGGQVMFVFEKVSASKL